MDNQRSLVEPQKQQQLTMIFRHLEIQLMQYLQRFLAQELMCVLRLVRQVMQNLVHDA